MNAVSNHQGKVNGEKINMELLAPAGGMEQLRAALAFGADAIYLAADKVGMRARATNFAMDEIPEAVALAHEAASCGASCKHTSLCCKRASGAGVAFVGSKACCVCKRNVAC